MAPRGPTEAAGGWSWCPWTPAQAGRDRGAASTHTQKHICRKNGCPRSCTGSCRGHSDPAVANFFTQLKIPFSVSIGRGRQRRGRRRVGGRGTWCLGSPGEGALGGPSQPPPRCHRPCSSSVSSPVVEGSVGVRSPEARLAQPGAQPGTAAGRRQHGQCLVRVREPRLEEPKAEQPCRNSWEVPEGVDLIC